MALSLGLALLGCRVLTGPSLPDLPPQNHSLDPADLRFGALVGDCQGWSGGSRPPGTHLLADVFFTTDQFATHPNVEQFNLVRQRGGSIVFEYHLPGYRVWIPIDSIPSFPHATIRYVPDPSRYDARVAIRFGPDSVPDPDLAEIGRLGGRVTDLIVGFYAEVLLPDASVPALRELRGVESLRVSAGDGCLFSG